MQSTRLADPFEPLNSSLAQSAEELGQCFPTFLGLRHPKKDKYHLRHPVANSYQLALRFDGTWKMFYFYVTLKNA